MSGETHTPNTAPRVGLQLHSIPCSLSLSISSLSPLSLSISSFFTPNTTTSLNTLLSLSLSISSVSFSLYSLSLSFSLYSLSLSFSLISWSRTCCCRVSQMDILSSRTRCVSGGMFCQHHHVPLFVSLSRCLYSISPLFQSDLSPSRSGQGCQRRPRTSS